jgi:hypothetical protein
MVQWLDFAPQDHEFRQDAIHLCVEIADRTQQLPSSYYITGVTVDRTTTRAGGFGVVYGGRYQGGRVAVKQPQIVTGIEASFTVNESCASFRRVYRRLILLRRNFIGRSSSGDR